MTHSERILITSLLQMEQAIEQTNRHWQSKEFPILLQIDCSGCFDLFQILLSAFSIPIQKQDDLMNLLDAFLEQSLSLHQTVKAIEQLFSS